MKSLTVLMCIILSLQVCAQKDNDRSLHLGLNFSYFPNTSILKFYGKESDTRLIGSKCFSTGITGILNLNEIYAIQSGLMFGKYNIKVEPWEPGTSYMENHKIAYVPLALRCSFLKYAFATGGFIFDFQLDKPGELPDQSGIGLTAGTGFNYEFMNRFSASIGPIVNLHSLLSYKNGINNVKIIEFTLCFGIYYRI